MMLVNTWKQRGLFSSFLLVCLLTAACFSNGPTLLPLVLYLLSYTGVEFAAGSRGKRQKPQWYLAYLLVGCVVYSILGFLLILSSLKHFGTLSTSGIEVIITSVLLSAKIVCLAAARLHRQGILLGSTVSWTQTFPLLLLLLILGAQLFALHGYPLLYNFARLGLSVQILRLGFTHCYLGLNNLLQSKNSSLSRQ